MLRKKKSFPFFILLMVFVVVFLMYSNIKISDINDLKDNFYTNVEEVDKANKSKRFGNFVSVALEEDKMHTGTDGQKEGHVLFKLFGFIPIKKVKVNMLPQEEVYAGGVPIGISVQTSGATVISDIIVDSNNYSILKNKDLKSGDIITKINNESVSSIEDIKEILKKNSSDIVSVEIIRDNKTKTLEVGLLKDKENKYKLGVWVKNDVSGIGTMTFIKEDGSYGALGHGITNSNSETIVPISSGNIYNCNLVGIKKGERNKPGELRAVFLQKNAKGDVVKNTPYGIFGKLTNNEGIIDNNISYKIGGRLSVKPGKAKIISSISGIREEYDIEIIKANFQTKSSDKSIVFRVTDERLLNLTGGIVQGMSGSPIIQDGKLVGAVTHVFLADSSKGYAVYSDWMLEQIDY